MPTTYSHYKMGQAVYNKLNINKQKIISNHLELFNIGVHGPDIFFYYNALIPNKINKIGKNVHRNKAQEFITNAIDVINTNKKDTAHLTYLYGFICHFALDVTCHPTVFKKTETDGISHGEIENELDRELMIQNNIDPITNKVANHINPTFENSDVIKDFYKDTTPKIVKKSLKDMVFNLNSLVVPSKAKRNIIYTFFKLTGHYKNLKGLIINYEKNKDCADTTSQLISMFPQAIDLAVNLINELDDNVNSSKNKIVLNKIYNYNFNGEKIETE